MRLYFYTQFPAVVFVHKTYTCDLFSNGCSVRSLTYAFASVSVDSRTSPSIVRAFAHLSTLVKLRTYDWLSLKPLANNRPQRRPKNIFRGITMGIGTMWGIHSLSPFILSCPIIVNPGVKMRPHLAAHLASYKEVPPIPQGLRPTKLD